MDRDAFLAAIAADPLDDDLRAIFADWLDENGNGGTDMVEAARQRYWPQLRKESKQWIVDNMLPKLADSGSCEEGHGYGEDVPMTYERLMDAANRWVDDGQYWTERGSESWREVGWYHNNLIEEFWGHFEIVTGKNAADRSAFFSCTC